MTMTLLMEELVRQNVRSLETTLAGRGAAEADFRDAEDVVRMALRCYEDIRLLWDRWFDRFERGIDAKKGCEVLRAAIDMFDEWLKGATHVGEFVTSVT